MLFLRKNKALNHIYLIQNTQTQIVYMNHYRIYYMRNEGK